MCGGKCRFDGRRAHFADRLRFGAGNLFLGDLRASLEALHERLSRIGRKSLGLALRLLDDRPRFRFGFAGLPLIVGKERLGLFAKLARLVELPADRIGAIVEKLSRRWPALCNKTSSARNATKVTSTQKSGSLGSNISKSSLARYRTQHLLHVVGRNVMPDEFFDDGSRGFRCDVADG